MAASYDADDQSTDEQAGHRLGLPRVSRRGRGVLNVFADKFVVRAQRTPTPAKEIHSGDLAFGWLCALVALHSVGVHLGTCLLGWVCVRVGSLAFGQAGI